MALMHSFTSCSFILLFFGIAGGSDAAFFSPLSASGFLVGSLLSIVVRINSSRISIGMASGIWQRLNKSHHGIKSGREVRHIHLFVKQIFERNFFNNQPARFGIEAGRFPFDGIRIYKEPAIHG